MPGKSVDIPIYEEDNLVLTISADGIRLEKKKSADGKSRMGDNYRLP